MVINSAHFQPPILFPCTLYKRVSWVAEIHSSIFFFHSPFPEARLQSNNGNESCPFSATYLISLYSLKDSKLSCWNSFILLLSLQSYQDHIIASTEDQELDNGAPTDSAFQLLQHTAEIVDLFNLERPLRNIDDIRLKKLNSFYSSMSDWREKSIDDNSSFISSKLWFDLQSLCFGFDALVEVKLHYFPHSCIWPAIILKKITFLKSESMQKSTKIVNSWQGSKNQNRSSFAKW